MPSRFTLTFEDEDGRRRTVALDAPRLRVGRGEENELRLAVSGLSRRHAQFELIGGRLYLSDLGSSNGTTVNGRAVGDAVEVYDGDAVVLGEALTLRVSEGAPPEAQEERSAPAADAPSPATPAPEAHAPKPSAFGPHVVVGGLVGLVLLAAVVLVALYLNGSGRGAAPDEDPLAAEEVGSKSDGKAGAKTDERVAVRTSDANARAAVASSEPTLATQPANVADVKSTASAGETDRDAVRRVMQRISNDDSPYVSDEGARDVARRAKAYAGSRALAERLRALSRGCAELTALARSNNLRPSLLAYAALAESEQGDPLEAARRMAPKLLTLRATFGTETANSTLLLVAAYPYPFDPVEGERTRRPHPLATRLVKLGGEHPEVAATVARSVWFLREQRGISDEAYDLVVRLLAVGLVAQRPAEFGLDAPPFLC
jgi:hypothetical protein